jgi:curved DNA-binding protein
MFGVVLMVVVARSAQYKGQDFNSELHLDLKDVYTQRTLTINKKTLDSQFRVENGQVIKITGYGAQGSGGAKGRSVHHLYHRQPH